jgi:hypothetical protein
MKLTKAQSAFLECFLNADEQTLCSITGAQTRMANRLTALGLLEWIGMGECHDMPCDKEYRMYHLTVTGENFLAPRGKE